MNKTNKGTIFDACQILSLPFIFVKGTLFFFRFDKGVFLFPVPVFDDKTNNCKRIS